MPDLITVIPSRGVIHSRTIEAVYRELQAVRGFNPEILFEHDLPIPDVYNKLVTRALESKPHMIWIVEEDILPPPGALKVLLECATNRAAPVVSAQYRIRPQLWAHKLDQNGKLIFAGTGCVLIEAAVFSILPQPWFRTDLSWSFAEGVGLKGYVERETPYGGQDISFYGMLARHKIKFVLADVVCDHLRVVEWGKPATNQGCHKISPIG